MVHYGPTALPSPLDSDPVATYASFARQLVDELGDRYDRQCRVYAPAVQSIPNNANTTLDFTSEDYDPKAMHSTSSNPSRVTAGKDGRYRITANVAFLGNATGYRTLMIRRSGTLVAQVRYPPPGATAAIVSLTTTVAAVAADYFDVQVLQNTGAALDVSSGAQNTFLCVEYAGG